MKTFSINDIPEFSKKERIVVVGVIGKSAYRYPNKATPLVSTAECKENGIECHWDERRGVLYLHVVSYLDTQRLAELAANLSEHSKSTEKDADAAHWLVAAGELSMEACRAMALLFHICHIVVLSSPTPVFDLGCLQLFKACDAFRTELATATTEALSSLNLGGTWESHGRSCCPRLVFHFRRAPTALRRNLAALKRHEHAVEDQLYYVLRKARIITNVCAKSLFAIPKNEEFVYMSATDDAYNARDVSSLIRGLVKLCSAPSSTQNTGLEERATFQQFLQGHIDLALGEGFDDNVGKYAMTTSFFELPSAVSWRQAASVLTPLYLEESEELSAAAAALHNALATDVRFSQARCAKVLPIAQASYTEGLPSHYSSQHHAHKVSVALGVLDTMARGPLAGGARERLRAACAAVWSTRRLCEAPSLTDRLCVLPQHDNTKEHSSGVRYVSACNCGRSKCSREDPYTVRSANHAFYTQAADACAACATLHAIQLPVFQPSTPTYRAASVKGASSQEDKEVSECRGAGSGEADTAPSQDDAWSPDALSPGSPGTPGTPESSPKQERFLVPVRADSNPEKVMTRQPSTTEYLPGMLHLASPPGLLPAFSSWSLVMVGPSSLYSHSMGLPEHLQPGFLPHTNYLLPWDCAVRMDVGAAMWRTASRGGGAGSRGGKGAQPHHNLTVKIFIGFEYECPRGHRLMMASPDTVVSGGAGNTISSGAGAKLAATDMPLCVPCLCRAHGSSSGAVATPSYLTRIHVVTPKAPVHVTLDPRAQPVPGGPTFVPQPPDSAPLKLSPSAYWVLRLPFVYADERGLLPRPRPHQGALIAPVFGLQD